MKPPAVPYFRPPIGDREVAEVSEVLRSGWLTSGAKGKAFEENFAAAVGGQHAIAVTSCTAALHLAIEALGLGPGQAVLVPTMTFAATAEVVRYLGGVPILVDCEPHSTNLDLDDARRKIAALRAGELSPALDRGLEVVGMIPVHVGGYLMDLDAIDRFAADQDLWVVEDAAHAFPAAWRASAESPWRRCGEHTAAVSCYSFYANKTITTGEGGMAVTDRQDLADRIRLMTLHGLSKDAWGRYTGGGAWDYRIVAPGFKYNMPDTAAALGLVQLESAEAFRTERQAVAEHYLEALAEIDQIGLPLTDTDRLHAWHLFPIRLRLDRLRIDRNRFVEAMREAGVGFSVHWRPLHLHPYYEERFGWRPDQLPVASTLWPRLVSLPIYPAMPNAERDRVVERALGPGLDLATGTSLSGPAPDTFVCLAARGKSRAALRAALFRQLCVAKSRKIPDIPALSRLDLTKNHSLSLASDFCHGLLRDICQDAALS
nr:spore coat polysaccharide biosynthesis protein SpsC-like [Nerophis lumbriciformis]